MIESERIANALRTAIQAAQQRQQDSPAPDAEAPTEQQAVSQDSQVPVSQQRVPQEQPTEIESPEARLQRLFKSRSGESEATPSDEPPAGNQSRDIEEPVSEPSTDQPQPIATDSSPSPPENTAPPRRRVRVRKRVRKPEPNLIPETSFTQAVPEKTLKPSPFLSLVDYSIAALLIVVPLAMGGRQPFGHFLLSALAISSSAGWLLYMSRTRGLKWDWTPISLVFLLGVALVGIQLIPLSTSQVQEALPPLTELIPTWLGGESESTLGTWSTLSLYPVQTQRGLVTLVAYVLIFTTVSQRVQSASDVERVVTCVGIMSAGMAVFGLLQFFLSNGKFYWVYEHPFYSTDMVPKGSFGNQNHFAHFVVLGVPSIIYVMLRQMRPAEPIDVGSTYTAAGQQNRRKLILWVCGAGLLAIAFAVLRSESRGGIAALLLMSIMCLPLLRQAAKVDMRMVGGMTLIAAGLGTVLMIYGDEFLLSRVDTLFSADIDEIDNAGSRRAVWSANQQIIERYSWTGTGVGTHVEVYPTYLDAVYTGKEYTHAESGFLQVGQETGIPGLALVAVTLLIAISWCARGVITSTASKYSSLFLIMLAMLVVNAAHSVADFMWYIPGCMVVMVIVGACLQKLWLLVREEAGAVRRTFSVPRPVWAVGCGAVACLGVWMLGTLWAPTVAEAHYAEFLRLDRFRGNEEDEDARDFTQRRIAALVACVEADPEDARAHLRLANEYRELFRVEQIDSDNRMNETQLRDAVYSSQFTSLDEVHNWLEVAIGPSLTHLHKAIEHAKRSLQLCPAQGLGYVYLSNLAYLESINSELPSEYMSQAIALRPFDAHVQFAAGRDAWLAGERETAIEHWKVCYNRHRNYQRFIIWLSAEHVPASFFIKNFDSDVMALEEIKRVYKYLERHDDMQVIREVLVHLYLQSLNDVSEELARQYLVRAHVCFAELGDEIRAEACIQAAAKRDSNSVETRLALGRWRFEQGNYAEAADHLSWCARQSPGDEALQRLARKALDAKLNPYSKWILEDTQTAKADTAPKHF